MLSDEDRKRIEEEELHRYKIRERLEAPRRRTITLITLAGVVLLLLGWLVISSVQETGRSASALTIRESVIAYDDAATVLLQEKGTTDYTARVHIVPFSPQFVSTLSPGRYRVEVNYQVDRDQRSALSVMCSSGCTEVYAVRCSSGLCTVEGRAR